MSSALPDLYSHTSHSIAVLTPIFNILEFDTLVLGRDESLTQPFLCISSCHSYCNLKMFCTMNWCNKNKLDVNKYGVVIGVSERTQKFKHGVVIAV